LQNKILRILKYGDFSKSAIAEKIECTPILIIYPPQNPLFTRLSDPLQECPFNARRVPLNALQFSKKQ